MRVMLSTHLFTSIDGHSLIVAAFEVAIAVADLDDHPTTDLHLVICIKRRVDPP